MIPPYRIERMATDEEAWQGMVNAVRRLLFLPVLKTAKQAGDEIRQLQRDFLGDQRRLG